MNQNRFSLEFKRF